MSEGLSVDPNPGAIRMRRARDRKRQGRFASASWLAQTRSPASLRVVGLILANAVRQQSGRLPLLASLGIRLYARARHELSSHPRRASRSRRRRSLRIDRIPRHGRFSLGLRSNVKGGSTRRLAARICRKARSRRIASDPEKSCGA
jgi:hypothetical protein